MQQSSKKSIFINLKINKVIWFLTFSDTHTWGMYTLLNGLTGLYIANKLGTHSINVIGITVAIFFLTRALTQIPIGLLLDKIKSDKDEILVLSMGSIIAGLPFVIYPLVDKAILFYILHFIFGLGISLNLNAWRKLFAKNVDKEKEGLGYGVYETIMSIGSAFLSFLGGQIANINPQYFNYVISGAGIVIMMSSIWSLLIFTISKRNSQKIHSEKLL